MLALHGHVVARGKVFDHLHVRREASACKHSFEQIMAEQRIFRNTPRKRCLKSIHVVDALAGVRTFAEKILVNVGYRCRIRIHATGAGR